MLALVLQKKLGKAPCRYIQNWLISTLAKVIYFKKVHFFRGLKNLSSLHKTVWRSAEKKLSLFSNMLLLA
jgi:hypothetical protein